MDHTIVHFEIPADQPERAAKFYRELFGWNINRWENPGGIEYWTVETVATDAEGRPVRQGVNGGLMPRMYPNQPPVNYIAVEDVDEAVAKAERLGAKVLREKTPVPGMGWFAQLSDTEGNVIAVWETDMAAAPAAAAQADGASK
ncbi:MAG TPA: VOC family protein [Gemmatimonadales bacterium]|nr:VOC family protein [Gemmatimonadales bacterium]